MPSIPFCVVVHIANTIPRMIYVRKWLRQISHQQIVVQSRDNDNNGLRLDDRKKKEEVKTNSSHFQSKTHNAYHVSTSTCYTCGNDERKKGKEM